MNKLEELIKRLAEIGECSYSIAYSKACDLIEKYIRIQENGFICPICNKESDIWTYEPFCSEECQRKYEIQAEEEYLQSINNY